MVETGSRAVCDVLQHLSDNCTLVVEDEVIELGTATPEGDKLLQGVITQDEY